MDWYVSNSKAAASLLRDEFTDYVARHASPDSDLLGASLIFSELVTNAVENSDDPVWVSLDWGRERPVLTVHDLGPGFDLDETSSMPGPESVRGRGLMIVTHLTDKLGIAAKAAGGTKVSAMLPVRRPPTSDIDPSPAPVEHLLLADEVTDAGVFGREAFLRALVVQIARTVEHDSGPAAAERVIASVGASIGARIEDTYRLAHTPAVDPDPDAQLTAAQMAQLFVQLKHGIEGDFFVIEATDDRIVLGNRHCPFGEAVRQAPSLCRMTSSVFGGIAARNGGSAAVHLEERIAVGDPECRVTVWLRDPPEEIAPAVHFYGRKPSSRG